MQARRDAAALAALAAPRVWRLADGRSVEVATPETLRARELAAAHAALAAADGSNLDARLTALLAAKYHAKAVDCRCGKWAGAGCAGGMGWMVWLPNQRCQWCPAPVGAGAPLEQQLLATPSPASLHIFRSLTREIVSLVDREADLLNRLAG